MMLTTRSAPVKPCRQASCSPLPQAQTPYQQKSHKLRIQPTAAASSDTAVTDPSNGTSSASATAEPAPAPAPFQPSASATVSTKMELLEQLAALDRGTLATAAQKDLVESLVQSLEASGAGAEPFSGSPAPVEGRWQLIYNSKAVFTASPFFPAFQRGLVQDDQLAQAIFAFTDAIPGAEIGTALQTVSLLSSSLISEVDMNVFPGLTGTVVTSSRLQVLSPTRLALDVQSTRVVNSSFGPFLDGVSVPVEQLMEAVRGPGVTRVIYDVTYVDESLRVTRCGDQLLVHRRL